MRRLTEHMTHCRVSPRPNCASHYGIGPYKHIPARAATTGMDRQVLSFTRRLLNLQRAIRSAECPRPKLAAQVAGGGHLQLTVHTHARAGHPLNAAKTEEHQLLDEPAAPADLPLLVQNAMSGGGLPQSHAFLSLLPGSQLNLRFEFSVTSVGHGRDGTHLGRLSEPLARSTAPQVC